MGRCGEHFSQDKCTVRWHWQDGWDFDASWFRKKLLPPPSWRDALGDYLRRVGAVGDRINLNGNPIYIRTCRRLRAACVSVENTVAICQDGCSKCTPLIRACKAAVTAAELSLTKRLHTHPGGQQTFPGVQERSHKWVQRQYVGSEW